MMPHRVTLIDRVYCIISAIGQVGKDVPALSTHGQADAGVQGTDWRFLTELKRELKG
jgi:hypothetical protein